MTPQQEIFTTYVRTLMVFELRFKGDESGIKPVHVPSAKVSEMISKGQLNDLVKIGDVQVYQKELPNGYKKYYYEATKAGKIDYSILEKRELPKDKISQTMIKHLLHATLKENTPSTPYFDTFQKWKNERMDLFVRVDEFGFRFHSPVTSLNKEIRKNLLIETQQTASIDIKQSQPTILANILERAIGDNEFTDTIKNGIDVYEMLKTKAGLSTRDEAKKKFFEITFGRPSDTLTDIFGGAEWVQWINELKRTPIKSGKPKNGSYHNNLAMLLQRTESGLMRKVWNELVQKNIPFLSVHDEVIVKTKNVDEAKIIVQKILLNELKFGEVNVSEHEISEPNTTPTPAPELLPDVEVIKTERIEHPKKEQPQSWSNDIAELETYFANINLPDQPVILNQCSTITNTSLFIENHFAIIKANNGNKRYLPYLNRLEDLKQILTIR